MTDAYVKKNLCEVQHVLESACVRASRATQPTLVAAVKYADNAELAALLDAGVTDVGENRVQQLLAHLPVYEQRNVRVHFIGTLQKNKIKYIIDKVHAIHSVDSASLAAEIARHAAQRGICVRVFVEVNIGREEAKGGVLPEEAKALCREILAMPSLSLCGLMTMAPRCESEEYHAYFRRTRELAEEIWQELQIEGKPLLSMGMSESLEEAVLEGADLVRVGRRLFVRDESDTQFHV